MSGNLEWRYAAPISYSNVRLVWNAFRALGALLIVIAGAVALAQGLSSAGFAVGVAVLILLDAIYRLRHDGAVTRLLVIDITLIGFGMMLWGPAAFVPLAAFLYFLTAAMLLTSLSESAILVGYGLLWGAPITLVAPVLSQEAGVDAAAAGLEVSATVVFVIGIITLLAAAGLTLHKAARRNTEALETERKASLVKNEFVSMVSHELRTPLTSIAGFTDTLRASWADLEPGEINEFLDIMQREAAHLSDLVEDVLVIPRLEAGQIRPSRASSSSRPQRPHWTTWAAAR